MNAAYLDLGYEQHGIIFMRDVLLKDGSKPKASKIGQVLNSGQLIAVQVKQAINPSADLAGDLPIKEKASRVSMDITLPGRHLIHAPFTEENKVSKRVKNKTLRKNMNAMLEDISGMSGFILRASAANAQTDVLIREGKILKALWDSLEPYLKDESEPNLIMLGPDAAQRLLSDFAVQNIGRIAVSTMNQYQDIEDWCELYAPDLVTKIDPAKEGETVKQLGLFESYGIVEAIDSLLQPYAFLPSGGNIVIQNTAALTAIDVNQSMDKSILNTNLEAAKYIALQLRLRNIGGTILIDFINMKSKKQKDDVLKAFENEATFDPCTLDIHGWTKTGLLEVTRARRTPSLHDKVSQTEY
jgi:Rne/Rng family ribonuclease